ncbi:hypothetical protein MMC09_005331 [Bachmanniomyces sp. S44760]|nr:hypothetical protein [Bachmanniomyces sp. S44760]
MRSNRTSNSSAQLRRAKSASSVTTQSRIQREAIFVDPERARRDAILAASLAFGRAEDKARGNRTKTVSAEPSEIETKRLRPDELKRKHSVRFVGPEAKVQRQRSITRRIPPNLADKASQHRQTPLAQRQSRQSITSQSESIVSVLPQRTEWTTATSTPSSYRRLRKTRSALDPRKRPSLIFRVGTPRSEHGPARSYQRLSGAGSQSHNGLRNQYECSPSYVEDDTGFMLQTYHPNANQDAAIKLARDQYLRELDEQRLRERPSFLDLRARRRAHKAFRRTVRTGSANNYGSAVASSNQTTTASNQGLVMRAKSLSVSIKGTFKRIFHRKSSESSQIPAQQLDASRAYFHDYITASSGVGEDVKAVPEPDDELLFRVHSRPESPYTLPVHLARSSRPGSIRSARSFDSPSAGKSRVTSWNDSNLTGSMSSRELKEYQMQEKKRLSIIQENGGPHQPSSSAARFGLARRNAHTIFRKPVRNSSAGPAGSNMVDSRRLFSALQKRLEASDKASSNQQQLNIMQDIDPRTQPQNNLGPFVDHGQHPMATVRQVQDTQENTQYSNGIQTAQSAKIPEVAAADWRNDGHRSSKESSSAQRLDHAVLASQQTRTPQEIAILNERKEELVRRPLQMPRETKSAFFPTSTRVQQRPLSPYRRAIQDETRSEDDTVIVADGHDVSRHTVFGYDGVDDRRLRNVTGSESAYSRSISGRTPLPQTSVMSLNRSTSSGEPGTAVIIEPQVQYVDRVALPAFSARTSSDKSSGAWKGWMASEIEQLNNQAQEDIQIYDAYPPRHINHRREKAQIDSDDIQIKNRPTRSLTTRSTFPDFHTSNERSRPPRKQSGSNTMVERFPEINTGEYRKFNRQHPPSTRNGSLTSLQSTTTFDNSQHVLQREFQNMNIENHREFSEQRHLPAQQRSDTSLRNKSSQENRQYYGKPYPRDASVRRRASQASFRSQGSYTVGHSVLGDRTNLKTHSTATRPQVSDPLYTDDKTQSWANPDRTRKYSPEREARLRRMQSSNYSEHSLRSYHQQENQVTNYRDTFNTPSSDDDTSGAGLHGPVTIENRAIGSQKMVDMFLNSRRNSEKRFNHNTRAFL